MSTITRPILLDETGQAINKTLGEIRDALLRGKAAIDDDVVSTTSAWSSAKVVAALTVESTASALQTLSIAAVETTPVVLVATLPSGGEYVLRQIGSREVSYTFTVPGPGVFDFGSGVFTPADGGEAVSLPAFALAALPGSPNVFTINDAAARLTATFRTLPTNEGWDVIYGGDSSED